MQQLLILAHALDGGAQAVAGLLAPRLGPQLVQLRPERLALARWSHQLSAGGLARTRLSWPGQGELESSALGLVWNRIRYLPQAAFRHSPARDQDYAGAELQALVCSWLAELGSRVEPPLRPFAMVTPQIPPLRWMTAAWQCGVPAARDELPVFTVLRTPLALVGAGAQRLPPALAAGCHQLAQLLGVGVIQLGFSGQPEAPRLVQVELAPALAGEGEAAAVANSLLHNLMRSAQPKPQAIAEVCT